MNLSEYPIHCPKCGMSFHRGAWPHMGQWGTDHQFDACGECEVRMHHGQVGQVPGAAGKVKVAVDPTEARRAWGLE